MFLMIDLLPRPLDFPSQLERSPIDMGLGRSSS